MKIVYISADQCVTEVNAQDGYSVMQAALVHDVDGIVGECGGSMMCATCHCYVDDAWIEVVGRRGDQESELLECAASDVRPTSRLSCQIKMSAKLDGLVVYLPEAQV